MKCETRTPGTHVHPYLKTNELKTDMAYKKDIFNIHVCIWSLAALCCIGLIVSLFLFDMIKSNEIKIEEQDKKIKVLIDKFEVQ